jgi:predicted O-methyltransferase YrrM
VDVWWGDAREKLRQLPPGQQIDLLFLDGVPKESLEYLAAAEPFLAPGATVVADNAVVFAQGGMRPYLEYVRGGGGYSSSTLGCKLEWREDVDDGLEVSRRL